MRKNILKPLPNPDQSEFNWKTIRHWTAFMHFLFLLYFNVSDIDFIVFSIIILNWKFLKKRSFRFEMVSINLPDSYSRKPLQYKLHFYGQFSRKIVIFHLNWIRLRFSTCPIYISVLCWNISRMLRVGRDL